MIVKTKYLPPTETNGSRVIAKTTIDGRRAVKTIPYDYRARTAEDVHAMAVKELCSVNGITFNDNYNAERTDDGFIFIF